MLKSDVVQLSFTKSRFSTLSIFSIFRVSSYCKPDLLLIRHKGDKALTAECD